VSSRFPELSLDIAGSYDNIRKYVSASRVEDTFLKDTITLESRIFDCTRLVLQRYGLDDHTLRKLVRTNIVPGPVKIGNKNFFDRKAIESRILEMGQSQT
jgi:hypothetical protein